MVEDFPTRLKYFRSLRDLTQSDLAKSVGISQKQVSDYEVGASKPRQATFLKILKALKVSEKIFNNSDLCSLELSDLNDLEEDHPVTFSNDNGDKIILPSSLCNMYNFLPVTDLSVFHIKGNSMAETLMDGDLVLVDTKDRIITSGLIYLIYLFGEKMVARLHRSQPELIDIIKDNNSYPQLNAVDESQIIVLGKIVFRQGLI